MYIWIEICTKLSLFKAKHPIPWNWQEQNMNGPSCWKANFEKKKRKPTV